MSDFSPLAHPTDEYLDFAPVDTLPVTTLPVDTPSVFAELVCADSELLRAEFETLIAANYPTGDGQHCRPRPRRMRPHRTDLARPGPQAVLSPQPGSWSGSGDRTGWTGAGRAAGGRGPP
jgi:hypothetical protein